MSFLNEKIFNNVTTYTTPNLIETTEIGRPFSRYIETRSPFTYTGSPVTYTDYTGLEAPTIYYPPVETSLSSYEQIKNMLGKEAEVNVKLDVKNFNGEHVVCCKNKEDLSPEKILLTMSAIKGRLMLEVVPICVKEFQCSMTPAVRQNIIQASRRAKMYGKKMPIIARFDEYGNPLPEKIEINDSPGVNIKILNPSEVGELYFSMSALDSSDNDYTITYDSLYSPTWEDDPF